MNEGRRGPAPAGATAPLQRTPLRAEELALHAAALSIALITLAPALWLFVRAHEQGFGAGLRVLTSPALVQGAWQSVLLTLLATALCVVIAVPVAWLTHATDLPLRATLRRLAVLPLAVPSFVAGFVVIAVFGHGGIVEQAGVALPEIYGMVGALAALSFTYPYVLLPTQAALSRVDPRAWEAARSLGASPLRAFVSVVLPQARGAIGSGALLVGLYVLGDFGAVSLMRFPSLSYRIYLRYGDPFGRHEAVWYAIALGGLALLLVGLVRFLNRRVVVSAASSVRPWPVVPLGRWRWPAFVFVCGVVFWGAALPVLVVSYWLVRGLMAGNTTVNLQTETINTLLLGVTAAVVITALGLVPALLRRFGSPTLSRFVDRLCHVGYALPGLVVALALVYLGSRALPSLYQTVWMLQLAYVVRFLPQAIGNLNTGLDSQSPRLYDAARSLGLRPIAAWLRVVIPVAAPAIAASLLAVFLSVVKELPATLLLKPPGFSTLAQRVWSLTQDAYFTAAAPTVLVLLLIATGALWLRPDSAIRREGTR